MATHTQVHVWVGQYQDQCLLRHSLGCHCLRPRLIVFMRMINLRWNSTLSLGLGNILGYWGEAGERLLPVLCVDSGAVVSGEWCWWGIGTQITLTTSIWH